MHVNAVPADLPAEVAAVVPPELLAECESEWAELLQEQRELWRQQYGEETPEEPQLSRPELEPALRRIMAEMAEDEERWRGEAAVMERRWAAEADEMFARWRGGIWSGGQKGTERWGGKATWRQTSLTG